MLQPNDAHYLLRPETIESLWYLYYFTGNKTYQDWGWNIFQVSLRFLSVLSLILELFDEKISKSPHSCKQKQQVWKQNLAMLLKGQWREYRYRLSKIIYLFMYYLLSLLIEVLTQ